MDRKSVPQRLVLVQVEKPAGCVKYRRVDPEWEAQQVRVMCAWCGRLISGPIGPAIMVSHGICKECKTKLLREVEG